MKKQLIPFALAVFALASCTTTKSLYSWYDYENVTYEYSKKSTDELRVRVAEVYKKMLENQKGSRGAVPPGLYAEYGYLLCKTGKTQEGLSFLKEEIKHYPESEPFISRIIKQLEQ